MILQSVDDAEIRRAWLEIQALTNTHEGEMAHDLRRVTLRALRRIEAAIAAGQVVDFAAFEALHRAEIEQVFQRHITDSADTMGRHVMADIGKPALARDWLALAVAGGLAASWQSAASTYAAWTRYHATRVAAITGPRRGRELGIMLGRELERRALSAAADEIHLATQTALTEAGSFTGAVRRRMWMSRLDGRERPAHHDAHKQIVALDKPFIVDGERLRFPGDPRVSFANWKRCRCASALLLG